MHLVHILPSSVPQQIIALIQRHNSNDDINKIRNYLKSSERGVYQSKSQWEIIVMFEWTIIWGSFICKGVGEEEDNHKVEWGYLRLVICYYIVSTLHTLERIKRRNCCHDHRSRPLRGGCPDRDSDLQPMGTPTWGDLVRGRQETQHLPYPSSPYFLLGLLTGWTQLELSGLGTICNATWRRAEHRSGGTNRRHLPTGRNFDRTLQVTWCRPWRFLLSWKLTPMSQIFESEVVMIFNFMQSVKVS